MRSTSTRTIFPQTLSLALALGAGLILLPPVAQAQSTDANSQPAATNAAAALDLGDCPDNADGLGQGKTFTCNCPPSPIRRPSTAPTLHARQRTSAGRRSCGRVAAGVRQAA